MIDNEFRDFQIETRTLLKDLDDLQSEIALALTGNKLAARRTRLKSVEIEGKFKQFRRDSMKFIQNVKKVKTY